MERPPVAAAPKPASPASRPAASPARALGQSLANAFGAKASGADLAVARLLADRLMVMRRSKVVEAGLTDQILDDPQHPYSQLLVSSVLQP